MANHIANITYHDYHDFKPGFSLDLRRVNILVGEDVVSNKRVLASIYAVTSGLPPLKYFTMTSRGCEANRPETMTINTVYMNIVGDCRYRGAHHPNMSDDERQVVLQLAPGATDADLLPRSFNRRSWITGSTTAKLVNLYTALIESELGDLLLIDELENSMHYKTIESMAVNLQKLSKERDKQIVATVNSYECLRSLYYAFAAAGDLDNFQIVRLERNNDSGDKTIPIVIADENLVTCMAAGYEIR